MYCHCFKLCTLERQDVHAKRDSFDTRMQAMEKRMSSLTTFSHPRYPSPSPPPPNETTTIDPSILTILAQQGQLISQNLTLISTLTNTAFSLQHNSVSQAANAKDSLDEKSPKKKEKGLHCLTSQNYLAPRRKTSFNCTTMYLILYLLWNERDFTTELHILLS